MEACCCSSSSRKKQKKGENLVMELNWSTLPRDLLVEIAKRTMSGSLEDFMGFRGVCTSWRSASKEDEVVGAKSNWPIMVPLLMLAEKEEEEEDGGGGNGRRDFYSLSKQRIFMSLPVSETKGKKCLESRFGWLLTIPCSGDVELMNPFSSQRISLPNFKTICTPDEYTTLRRFPEYDLITRSVLSANPSHTSDFVLVVITTAGLAFWKPGKNNWIKIPSLYGIIQVQFIDVNYFKRDGRFYAINWKGDICAWNANASGGDFTQVVPQVIFTLDNPSFHIGRWNAAYLVESSTGELLLVARNGQRLADYISFRYGATEFRVYRIDIINGQWERILHFNNDAIFVGQNAAFSIPVDDTSIIKSNSIYFTDDCFKAFGELSPYNDLPPFTNYHFYNGQQIAPPKIDPRIEWGPRGNIDAMPGGGKDMGIYNLHDGSIQRFHPDTETLSFTCPPLWIAPSSFSWLP